MSERARTVAWANRGTGILPVVGGTSWSADSLPRTDERPECRSEKGTMPVPRSAAKYAEPAPAMTQPPFAEIEAAADALRRGELVVMPTETVYGLAADATNEEAIRRIFALKGRPSDNPLIVHVGTTVTLTEVAREVPDAAWTLVNRFWPGPLTLVLPRAEIVPHAVSAGLDTVAVRMPNHPVALALLAESERPLATPSANRFMALSPTRAEDVSAEIRAGAAAVLNGGPCAVGLESTVLSLVGPPTVLRPGAVTRAQLAAVLGTLGIDVLERPTVQDTGPRAAPGGYVRHYSPKTPVTLAERLGANDVGLALSPTENDRQIAMPSDPAGYAARLYAALAELDRRSPERIVIETPPVTAAWAAVRDRLARMMATPTDLSS